MAGQTAWAIVIVAVLAAALIGFFLGRVSSGGARQRVGELEAEVRRHEEEINNYKREVDAHFDKTATLFVSMAGSYKNLFEHLSSGYERLSAGSTRDLFKERVTALLLDGPKDGDADRAAFDEEKQASAVPASESPQFEEAAADADAERRDEEIVTPPLGEGLGEQVAGDIRPAFVDEPPVSPAPLPDVAIDTDDDHLPRAGIMPPAGIGAEPAVADGTASVALDGADSETDSRPIPPPADVAVAESEGKPEVETEVETVEKQSRRA